MDDNKLREIFASIADVEPLSDGWPVLSKFANAVLAAADAEAVPDVGVLVEALRSLAAVARRYLPDYDEHPEVQKADEALAEWEAKR